MSTKVSKNKAKSKTNGAARLLLTMHVLTNQAASEYIRENTCPSFNSLEELADDTIAEIVASKSGESE